MSLKEEIDLVIQEEERKLRRRTAQTQRVNRFVKPTYMAVLIAKAIVFLKGFKKQADAAPVAPPALKRHLGKQKPPVTIGTLIREDLTAFKRRLFPVKKAKKLPGSNESWKDWEGQI